MCPPKGQALGRLSASWACRTLARIVGCKRLAASWLGKRRLAGSKITTVCATGGAHITSRGKATRGVVAKTGLAAIAFTVTAGGCRGKTTVFTRGTKVAATVIGATLNARTVIKAAGTTKVTLTVATKATAKAATGARATAAAKLTATATTAAATAKVTLWAATGLREALHRL